MPTRRILKDLIELLIEDTRWAPQRSDTPLTTENLTKGHPLPAVAFTTQQTNPLWRHLGINSEAFFTHVGQCSECKGLLESLLQQFAIAAQGVPAGAAELIFRKLASGMFAQEPEAVKCELPLFKCLDGDAVHTGHAWWRYVPDLMIGDVNVRESFYCMGTESS